MRKSSGSGVVIITILLIVSAFAPILAGILFLIAVGLNLVNWP